MFEYQRLRCWNFGGLLTAGLRMTIAEKSYIMALVSGAHPMKEDDLETVTYHLID